MLSNTNNNDNSLTNEQQSDLTQDSTLKTDAAALTESNLSTLADTDIQEITGASASASSFMDSLDAPTHSGAAALLQGGAITLDKSAQFTTATERPVFTADRSTADMTSRQPGDDMTHLHVKHQVFGRVDLQADVAARGSDSMHATLQTKDSPVDVKLDVSQHGHNVSVSPNVKEIARVLKDIGKGKLDKPFDKFGVDTGKDKAAERDLTAHLRTNEQNLDKFQEQLKERVQPIYPANDLLNKAHNLKDFSNEPEGKNKNKFSVSPEISFNPGVRASYKRATDSSELKASAKVKLDDPLTNIKVKGKTEFSYAQKLGEDSTLGVELEADTNMEYRGSVMFRKKF